MREPFHLGKRQLNEKHCHHTYLAQCLVPCLKAITAPTSVGSTLPLIPAESELGEPQSDASPYLLQNLIHNSMTKIAMNDLLVTRSLLRVFLNKTLGLLIMIH